MDKRCKYHKRMLITELVIYLFFVIIQKTIEKSYCFVNVEGTRGMLTSDLTTKTS